MMSSPLLVLGAMAVAVLLVMGITFWFWYRTLHDEAGPAFVATVVTLAAFAGIAMVFLQMSAGGGGGE